MPELSGRALNNGRALDPTDIGSRHFPTVRRGLDADAVRRFLLEIADQVRESRRVEEVLRAELEQARIERPVERDDATLASTVGAETSRVLQVAHDAARDIVAASERRAAALVADGEAALAERARIAESAADHLLEKAKTDAALVTESTRNECRQMVEEAMEARRRILEDLVERRHALHAQLAQLRAGKDALGELIESVSTSVIASVAAVRERLEGAEEQASAAASNADIETSPEEELELDSLLNEPRIDRFSPALGDLSDLASGSMADPTRIPPVGITIAADADVDGIVRIGPALVAEEPSEESDRSHGLEELFARIRAERPATETPTAATTAESSTSDASTVEAPTAAAAAAENPAVERAEEGPVPVDEAPAAPDSAAPLTAPSAGAASSSEDAISRPAAVVEPTTGGAAESTVPQATAGEVPSAVAPAGEVRGAVDGQDVADEAAPASESDDAGPALALSPDEAVLAQRDKILSPALSELARSLKRQLRVEENELLDAFRNLGREADHESLLPAQAMSDRLIEASIAPLHVAWQAGEIFLDTLLDATQPGNAGAGSDAEVREIATRLAEQVVDPIRRRIVASLAEQGGEGDRASAIGVVFRDWRGVRVDGLAGDFALDAFAAGTLKASVARACSLAWLADDGGTTCSDCDDNAIAGSVTAGEPFPTGHRHPPVHPGCRCILIPAAE